MLDIISVTIPILWLITLSLLLYYLNKAQRLYEDYKKTMTNMKKEHEVAVKKMYDEHQINMKKIWKNFND